MESAAMNPNFSYNRHLPNEYPGKKAWKPHGLKRVPWFGIIPLVFCICCTGIAIGVVLESDGGLEKDWSGVKQPGVLLAYTSTLANALMGLAFAQAAVIFFWVQATAPIPISSLHYNWAGFSSTIGALKALCRGKAIRVSLVSILVTITALLRGPLMQRASYVQVVGVSQNGTIDLPVNYNISSLWGGKMSGLLGTDYEEALLGQFSPGFSDVVRDYLDKAPIQIPGVHCENCTLTIKAFGFDVINCTETRNSSDTYDVDPRHLPEKVGSNADKGVRYEKKLMFESSVLPVTNWNFTDLPPGPAGMMMRITTRRKVDTDCTGSFLNHTCFLNPGAMLYDLSIQGDVATLRSKSWKDDKCVEPIYMYSQDERFKDETTWLPLYQVGTSLFNSSSWLLYGDDYWFRTYNDGLIANLYAANWSSTDYNEPCYQYFNDPMDYIINSYREIAFRMSVRSAADPNYDLTGEIGVRLPDTMQKGIPYMHHTTQIQYAANRPALALAVIVSLVGPLATLFLFWGWWNLGRDFTMNPLELANAILQHERTKAEHPGETRPTRIDGSAAVDDLTIQDETATETTQMSTNNTTQSGIYQHHGHLASVFAGVSGNASADELASHFRHLGQTKNHSDGDEKEDQEEEPKIQYGVVESGAGEHLGFAVVSGLKGVTVRRPWKRELL
ncbi:hypothetical protein B0T20DRAFT_366921 [Sordaria brevicollis]|uniref:Uncharacterized protein n=1 Tax=Sordaria brevicollis TaxID=83679 RepID=A0AAE0PNG1_SORBR|nr:hypothetical protein B0T20DRAFT_366921 [Sordaria brevicollis]